MERKAEEEKMGKEMETKTDHTAGIENGKPLYVYLLYALAGN